MKQTRLVLMAVSVASMCSWATFAPACDNAKTTAAATSKSGKTTAVAASSSKGSACSADMAAKCSADMAASCGMKGKGTSATAASAQSAPECCSAGKSRSALMTASATTAPAGKVDAVMVGSEGSCSAHGAKTTASAAGAGGTCSGNGMAMKAGTKSMAHNCDACSDMAMCEDELKSMGATVQAVALKNGVMFVYTADASKVQSVQSAMARRGQRMNTMLASTDKATLCPECKAMRGAIASGKLNREQVNIEGGCLTLMTSSDPAMVAKIQGMAGLKGSAHTKS